MHGWWEDRPPTTSARSPARCGSSSLADRASLKREAKVPPGEQVRRVSAVAQTPLQRRLVSGVLSQTRQRDLSQRGEQIDPLATGVSTSMSCGTSCCVGPRRSLRRVRGRSSCLCSASACWPVPPDHSWCRRKDQRRRATAKTPGQQNAERREHSKPFPKEPHLLEEALLAADRHCAQAQPLHESPLSTSSSTTGGHEAGHLALTPLEQAIMAYLQQMRACGRTPNTLQWHRTEL